MGVIAKKGQWWIDLTCQPNWHELVNQWAVRHNVKRFEVYVVEVSAWEISKMRAYLHGVVLPTFAEAYNHAYGKTTYKPDYIKQFLKALFLGWIKDQRYQQYRAFLALDHRPKDIADWDLLSKQFAALRNCPEPVHTEQLSAEDYWRFVQKCVEYFYQIFDHPMPQPITKLNGLRHMDNSPKP